MTGMTYGTAEMAVVGYGERRGVNHGDPEFARIVALTVCVLS